MMKLKWNIYWRHNICICLFISSSVIFSFFYSLFPNLFSQPESNPPSAPPAQDLVSLAGAAASDLLQEEEWGAGDSQGTLILLCDGGSSPAAAFARLFQVHFSSRYRVVVDLINANGLRQNDIDGRIAFLHHLKKIVYGGVISVRGHWVISR